MSQAEDIAAEKWYRWFLSEAKKRFGRDWLDEVPDELRPAVLALHQNALTVVSDRLCNRKQRQELGAAYPYTICGEEFHTAAETTLFCTKEKGHTEPEHDYLP